MGKIVDAVTGGSARDAAKQQIAGTEKAMQEYKKGIAEAKSQINPLFDQASQQRAQGTQQAIDAMSHGFAPTLDVMNQGNMNAQQMLAGAAPQFQNALLGNQVDYGALQPQGINFDAQSFLSGMPQAFNPQQLVNTPQQPAPQATPQQQFESSFFNQSGNTAPNSGGQQYVAPYNPFDMSTIKNGGTGSGGFLGSNVGTGGFGSIYDFNAPKAQAR